MRIRPAFFVLAVAVFVAGPAPADTAPTGDSGEFVARLFDQLAWAMGGSDPGAHPSAAGALIADAVDVADLARSSAGPLWATGSAADQAETQRLILAALAQRTADGADVFATTTLAILGERAEAGATIVLTEARRAGYVPLAIDWRVGGDAGRRRIEDVVIAGLSVRVLLRLAAARLVAHEASLAALNQAIGELALPASSP